MYSRACVRRMKLAWASTAAIRVSSTMRLLPLLAAIHWRESVLATSRRRIHLLLLKTLRCAFLAWTHDPPIAQNRPAATRRWWQRPLIQGILAWFLRLEQRTNLPTSGQNQGPWSVSRCCQKVLKGPLSELWVLFTLELRLSKRGRGLVLTILQPNGHCSSGASSYLLCPFLHTDPWRW